MRAGLLGGDDEGVLGVAGGVVRGEVEGFEVVEVGLDLRAEVGAVAEMVEDGDDLVHGLEERVGDARGADGAGEGDVDSLHYGSGCSLSPGLRGPSICCLSWLKRIPRGLRASEERI